MYFARFSRYHYTERFLSPRGKPFFESFNNNSVLNIIHAARLLFEDATLLIFFLYDNSWLVTSSRLSRIQASNHIRCDSNLSLHIWIRSNSKCFGSRHYSWLLRKLEILVCKNRITISAITLLAVKSRSLLVQEDGVERTSFAKCEGRKREDAALIRACRRR